MLGENPLCTTWLSVAWPCQGGYTVLRVVGEHTTMAVLSSLGSLKQLQAELLLPPPCTLGPQMCSGAPSMAMLPRCGLCGVVGNRSSPPNLVPGAGASLAHP